MKKRLIIVAIIVAVVAMTSVAVAKGPGGCGMKPGAGQGQGCGLALGLGVGPKLMGELNLTQDQTSKLQQLRSDFIAKTDGLRSELQEECKVMCKMWADANPDANRIKAQLARMDGIRAQIRDAGVDFRVAALKVLTPEQRQTLQSTCKNCCDNCCGNCAIGCCGMGLCYMMGQGNGCGMGVGKGAAGCCPTGNGPGARTGTCPYGNK